MNDLVKLMSLVAAAKEALSAVEIEAMAAQVAMPEELAAEKQASYDEGFAAGAASVGSDKIYSQAEVDAMLAPLQAELDGVKAELEALKLDIDAKIEAAKADAVAALKAELKAKYDEQQVAEAQGETGFGALLG